MSPRAACRLDDLGFSEVYDYVAGKLAWLALGHPFEGTWAHEPVVADLAHRDVPEVAPGDLVGDIAEVIGAARFAVVLDAGTVAGVVRREALALPADTPVRAVLQPGPPTFRPAMSVDELAGYWAKAPEPFALITTLDGRYVGVIERDELDDDD